MLEQILIKIHIQREERNKKFSISIKQEKRKYFDKQNIFLNNL